MNPQTQSKREHPGLLQRTLRLQREAANEFNYALARAQKALAEEQIELSLEWCRQAARIAVLSNPGFFYSRELEALLSEIGRRTLGSAAMLDVPPTESRRFLHILTVAYASGGHTRAVSRWIDTCAQTSPSERHSVLVSIPDAAGIPAWLADSVLRSGGEIHELPRDMSWQERAAEMRARSADFDALILHIHPDDPLPNIAFHDRKRPVLFYSHADHMFSLGAGIASVIADIRPAGHDLSLRFRAPQARKVIVPIPLTKEPSASVTKAEARSTLGIPAEALVVLTVGGGEFKFVPVLGYSFAAMVQSVCAADRRILFLTVGLPESKPYAELSRSTRGRFRVVGFIPDREMVELYYRAADIYLDSFPTTSLTAVLEAARQGLPVQRMHDPRQPLMGCDDPGLESVAPAARSQQEFVAGAVEWLGWPEEKRLELGRRFQAAVLQEHSGASWKHAWLDPAIRVLTLPEKESLGSKPGPRISGNDFSFLGLGRASWLAEWPVSMFVAGAVLHAGHVSSTVRRAALLRSVKPLLFDTGGDGKLRMRFRLFVRLAEPLLKARIRRIRSAPRRLLRAIVRA